ncbi:MAG: protease pro-enzyme activation domain-containing protein [Thermoplasmata archaeon]
MRVRAIPRGNLLAYRAHSLLWGVTALLLLSSALAIRTSPAAPSHPDLVASTVAPQVPVAQLLHEPELTVADAPSDLAPVGSQVISSPPAGRLTIVVGFSFSNASRIAPLLAALSNSASPQYHHYLTRAQFNREFDGAVAPYEEATAYFRSFGVSDLTTFADRTTLSFVASPALADRAFHTSIVQFRHGGLEFLAPRTSPTLPDGFASQVTQVVGLGTAQDASLGFTLGGTVGHGVATPPQSRVTVGGYPSPVEINGAQFEFAPDFQVATDAQSLYDQYGYPTNESVATILWSGYFEGSNATVHGHQLFYGEDVGPFDPADVYNYYNETLPAGEPHSTITPVPVDGAAYPSVWSSYDGTGAVFENTLDLEMVGSTAPGAHIYNVYDANATYAGLDDALTTILQPNATVAGLANVSVVSNSWNGEDTVDMTWEGDLQQAQLRGITVLACSGDSDDNDLSSYDYAGPGNVVEYPGTVAFPDYGITSVGGTTVTLSPTTLHLESQVVWNISATDGGPFGSTGGISTTYAEPDWQTSTEANTLLGGAGRGVPDIAQIANNTLLTYSVEGYQYRATNATTDAPYYYAWGTSIASPLDAGLFAEIDHALDSTGAAWLGFLNPLLYHIANEEYTSNGEVTAYNSTLPTVPFSDVTVGSNYLYPAEPGYDLVTGWGSLDAYNYTMYILPGDPAGTPDALGGVYDDFDLTGLNVTSYYPTDIGGGVNTIENATVQQNFFLANSLGAPVYWIQNVIAVFPGASPHTWTFGFTGWKVYPFYGFTFYPTYVANSSSTEHSVTVPQDFQVETQLNAGPGLDEQNLTYYVNGFSCTLPVPGASYIIGSRNYTYSWEGTSYTNGPYPGGTFWPGFLAPQFGLVGGASLGIGAFNAPTAGTLEDELAPYGQPYVVAQALPTNLSNTQTGEESSNLTYTETTLGNWNLGISLGSDEQGIMMFVTNAPGPNTFPVQFNQTGAPSSSTWYVNITGGPLLSGGSASGSESAVLANGTYDWTANDSNSQYVISPASGVLVVGGRAVYVNLSITLPPLPVKFTETGLPSGATWYVNITGGPDLQGISSPLDTSLSPGTYPWSAAVNVPGYTLYPHDGNVTVVASAVTVPITIAPSTASVGIVSFNATGLGPGVIWYINLTGGRHLTGGATTVNATLPYGSYPYVLATDDTEWEPTLRLATLDVAAPTQHVVLAFQEVVFAVHFTPSSVIAEGWNLTLDGKTSSAANGGYTTDLPNGSYPWSVTPPSGYTVSPSSGTVVVQGENVTETLTFTALSSTPPGGGSTPGGAGGFLGGWGVLLLGVVVLVVVAIAVLVLLRRRGGSPGTVDPSAAGPEPPPPPP